jgi:hypothetical protein
MESADMAASDGGTVAARNLCLFTIAIACHGSFVNGERNGWANFVNKFLFFFEFLYSSSITVHQLGLIPMMIFWIIGFQELVHHMVQRSLPFQQNSHDADKSETTAGPKLQNPCLEQTTDKTFLRCRDVVKSYFIIFE